MHGAGGSDEFFYQSANDSPVDAPDEIMDFTSADLINLQALGVTKLIKQPIPTGPGKVARFRRSGSNGILDIDLDSDAKPEMRILLRGVTSFGNGQILLSGEADP